VTALALFTGEPPSERLHDLDWSWSTDLPDAVRQLLKRMLADRPENRPSAGALLERVESVLGAFEEQRELQVQRERALARVPDTPRPLPGNFSHGLSHGRKIAAIAVGLGLMVSLPFLLVGWTAMFWIFNAIAGASAIGAFLADLRERRRVALYTTGSVAAGTVDGVGAQGNGRPILHYSYQVDGESYRARWMVAGYETTMQAGQLLLVFYDPSNPGRSQPLAEFITGNPRTM
jgi:hypothetical protein